MTARGLLLAIALLFTVSAAAEELALEDFEQPDALSVAATTRQLEEGRALAWRPSGRSPHFLDLPLAQMSGVGEDGIELSEWDTLSFRYRISGGSVDWWGVKIVDHPLADGMQAIFRVEEEGFADGRWRTARFELADPDDVWGKAPDMQSQTLSFRLQAEGTPAVLIDDIRLHRASVKLSVGDAGPGAVEEAQVIGRTGVALENVTDEPLAIHLEADTDADGVSAVLPERVTVPAGASREVQVRLQAPADSLAPLQAARVEISARPEGEEAAVTVEIKLVAPAPEVRHPCLLLTREKLAEVQRKADRHEWARAIRDGVISRANSWLDADISVPDSGGQARARWYSCEDCATSLKTQSPTEHLCPRCGRTYSGWPWDDVLVLTRHNRLAKGVRDLGLAHQFTGEAGYARRAAAILLAYAEKYRGYDLHDPQGRTGPSVRGGGRVGPQGLHEALWLVPLVYGFDCVFDALTASERERIADGVLLPAAELLRSQATFIHNIPCWENAGYGMVGLTLGVDELASDAIYGEHGFVEQVRQGVNDDGQWFEGSWGYHYFTMQALQPLAVAAEHFGIDLYSARYRSMFEAPLQMMGPDGRLPAFNDSGRNRAIGGGRLYENAWAQWRSELIGAVVGRSSRDSLESLLYGASEVPAGSFEVGSRVFEAGGFAVLRAPASDPVGELIAGVPANYLALDFGPHGGWHGHPDKLGFELTARGVLAAVDAGRVAYSNPAYERWYKQTLAHNTVLVDGKSQAPTGGSLEAAAFADGASVVAASADGAYDGVRLRRVVALLDDCALDLVVATSDEAHQYDWVYHNRGELATGLPLSACEAPGKGAWQWAENWRSAPASGSWGARWLTDEKVTLHLHQRALHPAEIYVADGRGIPPPERYPFTVARQHGRIAAWATVLGFTDEFSEADVALVADDSVGPSEALGLDVRAGGDRYLLVHAPTGRMRAGGIALDGELALVRWRDGAVVDVLLSEGADLSVGDQTVVPDDR
jgi:hypothetical protein